ncbi:MAG: hypothetical protein GY936_18850 [Ignavibacteriae bacterium]|nr:hypothetical protein [Ignavibacteriota bacterium]
MLKIDMAISYRLHLKCELRKAVTLVKTITYKPNKGGDFGKREQKIQKMAEVRRGHCNWLFYNNLQWVQFNNE